MKQAERPFDIILMGATGFTGQLVAGHLEENAKNLNWAIAGRSLEKLNQVRDAIAPSAEVLVADSLSQADMEMIAAGTRVVASFCRNRYTIGFSMRLQWYALRRYHG